MTTAQAPATTGKSGDGNAIAVTDADNGKTVRITVGQTLELTLGSTYWANIASSEPTVLATDGAMRRKADDGCLKGSGCGTTSQSFIGQARGTSTVTASRKACGEALACSPSEANFKLTVTVA